MRTSSAPRRLGRVGMAACAALTGVGAMVLGAGPAAADDDRSTRSVVGWYSGDTVLSQDGHQLPGGFTIPESDRTGIVSMSASPRSGPE